MLNQRQQNKDWFCRDGVVTITQPESGHLAGSEGVYSLQVWWAMILLNIFWCLLLWSVSENSHRKDISCALLWNEGLVPSWHPILLVKIKYWLDFPVSNKVTPYHITILLFQMYSSWFHHFCLKWMTLMTLPVLCHSDIIFTLSRWRFLHCYLWHSIYIRSGSTE